jgi:hypothetical protein
VSGNRERAYLPQAAFAGPMAGAAYGAANNIMRQAEALTGGSSGVNDRSGSKGDIIGPV